MRLFILFLFCWGFSMNILAQDTIAPSQPFIKFTIGLVIKGQVLKHNYTYVNLDDRTFSVNELSFFRDNEGLEYAVYSERIIPAMASGNNVSVFNVPIMHVASNRNTWTGARTNNMYSYTSNEIAYSKNLGELKGLKIRNVDPDMRDKPEAKKYITKAKVSRVGIGLGIGMAAGGAYYPFNSQ